MGPSWKVPIADGRSAGQNSAITKRTEPPHVHQFLVPDRRSDEVTNEAPCARASCAGFRRVSRYRRQAHVLSDTCIHRGGALGAGKIKGDCVECPYHGWQYRWRRQVHAIPSLGDGEKLPARAKSRQLPGAGEVRHRVRVPRRPARRERRRSTRSRIRATTGARTSSSCSRSTTTTSARSRTGSMPRTTSSCTRNRARPAWCRTFATSRSTSGHRRLRQQVHDSVRTGSAQRRSARGDIERKPSELEAGSGHFGPNALITWLHLGGDNMFHQYFFEAPIDENRTRIFFVNMRTFMLDPAMDQKIVDINMEIAQEDIDVLVNLNPVRTPETTTKELLVPSDRPSCVTANSCRTGRREAGASTCTECRIARRCRARDPVAGATRREELDPRRDSARRRLTCAALADGVAAGLQRHGIEHPVAALAPPG